MDIAGVEAAPSTFYAASANGGLWKTTDITTSPANWILVDDFLSNLAIADICQDPRPGFQNIMYFATGESYGNVDAVQGIGVFKSTDGGTTWNFLSSTSTFVNGTRILCDYLGNVYLEQDRDFTDLRMEEPPGRTLLPREQVPGSVTWRSAVPTDPRDFIW